jgi:hypothetical protein
MMSKSARTCRLWQSTIAPVAVFVALFLLGGCGPRQPKLCPVTGTVMVNGQPTGGVYVMFHAVSELQKKKSPDFAVTKDDGTFSARVHGPGEFAVTVFWPNVAIDEGEVIEGEDWFQGKHQKPEEPVLKVSIQKGDNVLAPINLTLP